MIKLRNAQEFWAGLLFLGIGAVMLFGSAKLAQGTAAHMGLGYSPRLLCVLLILAGSGLLLKGVLTDGASIGGWNIRPMIFVLGSIIAFGLGLQRLGLVITICLAVGISSLRRSLLLSRGDPSVFVTRPVSATLLAVSALLLLTMMLPTLRKPREVVFQE
jgi:TctA family transporter